MRGSFKVSNTFLAVTLVVAALVLYMFSFQNQMFWDDDDFILHNTYVQDYHYIPKLFSENVIAGSNLVSNYWRPVLLLVFSAEWHAWHAWVPGWHAVNAVFHAANAVLLFFILLKLLHTLSPSRFISSRWLAFVIALFFVVHPLQVEAVAYVNSLGDSLSVFFMFLGLLFFQEFLHKPQKSRNAYLLFLASVLCYPLALMSKETAIIMPALVALLYLYSGFSFTVKGFIKAVWPYVVVALTYLALRATILNFKNSFNLYDQANVFSSSMWVRGLTFCKIIVAYVKLIFWPSHLHMERSMEYATSMLDWQVLLGVLLVFGLLAVAYRTRVKVPIISFGVLWFFISLAPTSNILVPINGLLYEHWLYVPIIGALIALMACLFWFLEQGSKWLQVVTSILLVLIIFALSTRAVLRMGDWANPVTFYEQTIKYAPQSYRIVNNLAMSLANEGQLQESIVYYKQAIQLDATNPVAYYNLGNTYVGLGNVIESVGYYRKALEADPKFLFAYGRLINGYASLGQYDKALATLDQYIEQVGASSELEVVRKQLLVKQHAQ